MGNMIEALEYEVRLYTDPDNQDSDYRVFLIVTSTETVRDPETGETAAQLFSSLQEARAYTLSELAAHIGNTGIHSSAEQVQNALAAISELAIHANTATIHVLPAEKTKWNAGAITADAALALAAEANGKADLYENRLARLEDSLYSNITGNPFVVSFGGLAGISLNKGVWNRDLQRVEC